MRIGSTEITLKRGDITAEDVDVVVNAANSSLLGGGGVDGAIHRAGGPAILEACQAIRARQGGCPTGEAVITPGGKLKARWVVHTVGPVWNGGTHGEPEKLRNAYWNSLQRASENGAVTIAFPSISTGAYRYPVEEAATAALSTAREWALQNTQIEEIRFVLFSDRDLAVYARALANIKASTNQPGEL